MVWVTTNGSSYIFSNDTEAELNLVRDFAVQNGAFKAVICDHWAKGGAGALDLADAVIAACDSPNNFDYLYPLSLSIEEKILTIAQKMYGAGKIEYTDNVLEKIKLFTEKVWYMMLYAVKLEQQEATVSSMSHLLTSVQY